MGAYIPVLVWLISGVICSMIAKQRNVQSTLFRTLIVVSLGPFAIPLIYLFKPEKATAV